MARGGFIAASVALKNLLKVVESGDVAKRALIEALEAAHISARGQPLIFDDPQLPSRSDDGQMILRDITAPGEPPRRGEMQDIPANFWTKLSKRDVEAWDWEEGYFYNSNYEIQPSFIDVSFNEKRTNELFKKHQALFDAASEGPPKRKKERLRDPSWEEWVAAVVILSQEKHITQGMKVTDLLDRVNARLQKWDCELKEKSTVAPTASAILRRFASNPPVAPVNSIGNDTQKR